MAVDDAAPAAAAEGDETEEEGEAIVVEDSPLAVEEPISLGDSGARELEAAEATTVTDSTAQPSAGVAAAAEGSTGRAGAEAAEEEEEEEEDADVYGLTKELVELLSEERSEGAWISSEQPLLSCSLVAMQTSHLATAAGLVLLVLRKGMSQVFAGSCQGEKFRTWWS